MNQRAHYKYIASSQVSPCFVKLSKSITFYFEYFTRGTLHGTSKISLAIPPPI